MLLLDLDTVFNNDRSSDPSAPGMTPDKLPVDWRELYEERAAIREYDGGLSREIAERYALLDTLALMRGETHH